MKEVLGSIRRGARRRKPLRRSRWKIALYAALSLGAVAGLALGVRAVLLAPALAVRNVEVRGTARVSPARVSAATSWAIGRPILLVGLDRLRADAENVAGVGAAAVARRMPDMIEITVVERVPIARAHIGGAEVLLDGRGAIFPVGRRLAGDERLPLVVGIAGSLATARLGTEDESVLRAIAALRFAASRRDLSEVTLDLSRRDRIELWETATGPVLWLDRARPERNLEQFFQNEDRVKEIAANRPIDLRYPDRLTLVPSADGAVAR
ncbi:MAG: FtsQ-type POTRA domain-containing protein [Acidobacteria bacterium]|nr:FtsQ-type POTRA domain-containing protein [Acidobacteriota bacterium]